MYHLIPGWGKFIHQNNGRLSDYGYFFGGQCLAFPTLNFCEFYVLFIDWCIPPLFSLIESNLKIFEMGMALDSGV